MNARKHNNAHTTDCKVTPAENAFGITTIVWLLLVSDIQKKFSLAEKFF